MTLGDMRVLLAIGAFMLALPFLGYSGFLLFVLIQFFLGEDIDADTVVAIAGVALLIGLAFLAASVAVLASKSRSNQ